jgi:NAD(P)-dependent dehydrogenase (short-subunit alcohol dehydrogenase family)
VGVGGAEREPSRSEAFHGRVALVTGGGTGLGRAISLRLAGEGAAVAVNYASSRAAAEETAAQIEADDGEALAVQADVADAKAVTRMLRDVQLALGPVDVLVANAAITEYVPFPDLESLSAGLWRRILDVNVIGAFLCAQAVTPGMQERGFGRIVVVSSNAAFIASGSSIPYVVSKTALISLTQCLARALEPVVQVNAVAPGWMLTPWVDKFLPSDVADQIRSGDVPAVDPDDVARLVAHLASNGSITGQVVTIDRGEMWLVRN